MFINGIRIFEFVEKGIFEIPGNGEWSYEEIIRSTPVHVMYHISSELPSKYRLQLATAKNLVKGFHLDLPWQGH